MARVITDTWREALDMIPGCRITGKPELQGDTLHIMVEVPEASVLGRPGKVVLELKTTWVPGRNGNLLTITPGFEIRILEPSQSELEVWERKNA